MNERVDEFLREQPLPVERVRFRWPRRPPFGRRSDSRTGAEQDKWI